MKILIIFIIQVSRFLAKQKIFRIKNPIMLAWKILNGIRLLLLQNPHFLSIKSGKKCRRIRDCFPNVFHFFSTIWYNVAEVAKKWTYVFHPKILIKKERPLTRFKIFHSFDWVVGSVGLMWRLRLFQIWNIENIVFNPLWIQDCRFERASLNWQRSKELWRLVRTRDHWDLRWDLIFEISRISAKLLRNLQEI